jgi:hypothetical protein
MTTSFAPSPYSDATVGEPLYRALVPPNLDTANQLWTLGGWSLILPSPEVRPAPELQRLTRQIRTWTGWSTRRMAEVVLTSHTTIAAIENGRPLVDGHSGDLRQRIVATHELVERVYLLADHDTGRVSATLDTVLPGRRSPTEELRSGEPARAYVTAIEVLTPRRLGLIVGNQPRRNGATAPLHE